MVEALKVRCSAAEQKVAEKGREIEALQSQIKDLNSQLSLITSKYESLKAGMAQGETREELASQKDKYLALVREIDDCIRLMQHGR